jgi:hypothetical protein
MREVWLWKHQELGNEWERRFAATVYLQSLRQESLPQFVSVIFTLRLLVSALRTSSTDFNRDVHSVPRTAKQTQTRGDWEMGPGFGVKRAW